MNNTIIYTVANSPAVHYAAQALVQRGIEISARPTADVTHLLLPVPSFERDGRIRGGGILEHFLADLPESVTVIGGNLEHPALQGYRTMDLLYDGHYLARNAAITADCAIRVASQKLGVVWESCPVLVIGWGRIGKCLAAKLQAMGAAVTVAARKSTDRNMLGALGYGTASPSALRHGLAAFRVIYNTVPAAVLDKSQVAYCRKDCVKIELASTPGIAGDGVISALGLPGKMAPESSGQLIAQGIIRLITERESL